MLIIEITSKKPLTPAQLALAQLKKQQQDLKRQRADANVMRKREQLLRAQQQQAAVRKSAQLAQKSPAIAAPYSCLVTSARYPSSWHT